MSGHATSKILNLEGFVAGKKYDIKAEFSIGNGAMQQSVVVYAERIRLERGPCYYCNKEDAFEEKLEVIEIVIGHIQLNKAGEGAEAYERIEKKFLQLALDGRCCCSNEQCYNRLIDDRNTEADIL